MPTTTPETTPKEGCDALACHIITLVFQDLKTWCRPHTEYNQKQRRQLTFDFHRTELYEIATFFVRRSAEEMSGIELLVAGIAPGIDASDIANKCRPIVEAAMIQARLFQQSHGLETYRAPHEELYGLR